MFKKIAAVQPFAKTKLIVWFVDGEARLFDASDVIKEREDLAALADEDFFQTVTLAAEGYGISWGADLDLSSKEIFDSSTHVDVVSAESKRVISDVVDARHAAKFSQAKLAAAAGVKQPVVARLETGVNSPRLDTLLKVLTPLGKTLKIVDLHEAADVEGIEQSGE